MENVYVLVTYIALLIALVGCGLIKVGDILERTRDRKYYQTIKNDAAFWQMKAEQTGINITDWILEKSLDKVEEMETANSGEPKEADEWLPF